MQCALCRSETDPYKVGYQYDPATQIKKAICYTCCAKEDKAYMSANGRAVLYWADNKVTNWPGSLVIKPERVKTSAHNIGKWRTDVWFRFEDTWWHGVHIGYNHQIIRCRRLKGAKP